MARREPAVGEQFGDPYSGPECKPWPLSEWLSVGEKRRRPEKRKREQKGGLRRMGSLKENRNIGRRSFWGMEIRVSVSLSEWMSSCCQVDLKEPY